jgi:hypothetical protein
MRNPKVQSALATFLVDQIYENVDVKADLQATPVSGASQG